MSSSVLIAREHTRWNTDCTHGLFFVLLALLAAGLALLPKPPLSVLFLPETMNSTSQLPVRIAILVLASLIAIAERFGLDTILGAFYCYYVSSPWVQQMNPSKSSLSIASKRIGYGFLIPMFFVAEAVGLTFTRWGSASPWRQNCFCC